MELVSRALIFLVLMLQISVANGADQLPLMEQVPQSFPAFQGFKLIPSRCRDLKNSTRNHLKHLQREGHKIALLYSNGLPRGIVKKVVKDSFMGKTYQSVDLLVRDVLEYFRSELGPENYQLEAKKCLNGSKSEIYPEGCTQETVLRFVHSGFVVLDSRLTDEPYVIHFYGDREYNYRKASIRSETLDSYLNEENISSCETKVVELKEAAQDKIMDFFEKDRPKDLLAEGDKSFNLLTHPWRLKTQNCNVWTSEVIAAALFQDEKEWSSLSRLNIKNILIETRWIPTKVSLGILSSAARLPLTFVSKANMNEGNFLHNFNVGDIVPTRTLHNWLERHSLINDELIISGEID